MVYYGFFIPTKHGTIGDGGSARLSSKSPRIRLCEDPKRHLQGQSLWQSCLRPVPPSKWTKMSCQSCHEFSIVFWYLGIAIQFPWDPIKKKPCAISSPHPMCHDDLSAGGAEPGEPGTERVAESQWCWGTMNDFRQCWQCWVCSHPGNLWG